MRHGITRFLCAFLSLGVIGSTLLPVLGVGAASGSSATSKDIEVVLAADAVSNNMSLTGFSDKLKASMAQKYGVPADKIHVSSVVSNSVSLDPSAWSVFNHYNVDTPNDPTYSFEDGTGTPFGGTEDVYTATQRIEGYYDAEHTGPYAEIDPDDPQLGYSTDPDPLYFSKADGGHIQFNGSTVTFYGYGVNSNKDFLFKPDSSPTNKIFNFTVDESAVNYHSEDGFGFIVNGKYTYNQSTGKRLLSGYLVLLTGTEGEDNDGSTTGAYVCELKDVDVAQFADASPMLCRSFRNGTTAIPSFCGGSATLIAKQTSMPPAVDSKRYLKVVASPTSCSLYQFSDPNYNAESEDGLLFDNVSLPDNFGAFGYGPISCYASHSCERTTSVSFSNLTIATDNSKNFADLTRSISWQYPDSVKYIVNVDNDGVPDFGDPAKLSSTLYYTMLNNAYYVGLGIDNPITIGSDTSVKGQANSFIERNNGNGTFIDRNGGTATLDDGVSALADYIHTSMDSAPTIAKPLLKTTFSGGTFTCSTDDTKTSKGNAISAYKWKALDIVSGEWTGIGSTSNSSNFTFDTGKYEMLALQYQDAVTHEWSNFAYSYVATVDNIAPVSQLTLDAATLMPDCSISSLKTGSTVTATDMSYVPNGTQIAEWKWTVLDATLTPVASMGKDYTVSDKPSAVSFDFASQPAGVYTISLAVKNSNGDWSSAYVQKVNVYKESNAITVGSSIDTSKPVLYSNQITIPFTVGSTNGDISAYRPIITDTDNNISVGDWTYVPSGTTSGSITLVGKSGTVQLQVCDVTGASKIGTLGVYYVDRDGDGVPDYRDLFPDDPTKSYIPTILNPDTQPAQTVSATKDADGTSAGIKHDDFVAAQNGDIISFDLNGVTADVPVELLDHNIGTDLTSTLKLIKNDLTAQQKATAQNLLPSNDGIVLSFQLDLKKIYSDNRSEYIHQLGGKIKVTVALSDADLAKITDPENAKLYYLDPSTNTLVDMHATFDLQHKTVTFYTDHFSTFIVDQGVPASTSTKPAINPPTGETSSLSGLDAIFVPISLSLALALLLRKMRKGSDKAKA